VDARTIKIIQNASDGGASAAVEPKEPASSGTVEAAATVEATAPQSVAEPETAAEQPEVAMATKQATTKPPPPAQSKSMQAIPPRDDAAPDTAASESTAPAAKNYSDNLQIKTSSQYRQADILLREAYAAYRSGDSQLAMERYNQVLKVDPGNRNALLARAAINIQNGNIDAAIRDYQTLLLANPKDSLAMSSLLGVGSYSPRETESQLKLMIRDDPDSPYLNFALANAYGAQHRWQEAQGYYFKALQNNPQDPNYAYNLAVSLEHISEPRSAITYYRRALDNFNNGLAIFSRDVVDQRLQVLGKL
jgi:tetratricopeptide (TPR) repeat protein